MKKILSMLLAVTAALAIAADPNQPRDEPVQKNRVPAGVTPPASVQDGVVVDDAQAGAAVSAKEQAYLSGLKKCESLQAEKRQQCVDAARRKAGVM